MIESLDIENHEQLASYLRQRDPASELVSAKTLAGGVSNRTVLVQLADGQSWVIKQALAKLRTKADWFSDPARVHREALGIRWLSKLAPPGTIPEFVFEDFENHLLAMQAVPEPHENWKEILLGGRIDPRKAWEFGELLVNIHRKSIQRGDELSGIFDDRQFFQALRIEPYYLYTAERVPESAPFLHALVRDSLLRRIALVHGDYSPKNVLIYRDQIVLLDHEVIHWGDPAFDVGFAMSHLISKLRHSTQKEALAQSLRAFFGAYTLRPDALTKPGQVHLGLFETRHTLACMLARVAGRSVLEYLSDAERIAQRNVVLRAMSKLPTTLGDLERVVLEDIA